MSLTTAECQARLAELNAAYYSIIAGTKEIEVKYKDRTVKYGSGNINLLKTEIMKLERQCGCKKNGRLPPIGIKRSYVC